MSEPFIAEIKLFAGNFAPRGFAFCNGQLLPISQNTALFSIIGPTYGGDGRTTTALPDMRSRAAMHPGNGPGLSSRRLGQTGGVETVTLTEAESPPHSHNVRGNTLDADSGAPGGNVFAIDPDTPLYGADDASQTDVLASSSVSSVGAGQAHNNMQPYLGINFIIALVGQFPSWP
jgi:microcystin-dependent protein